MLVSRLFGTFSKDLDLERDCDFSLDFCRFSQFDNDPLLSLGLMESFPLLTSN